MILVTGASGHVGGAALRWLVSHGRPAAALVRDPQRAAVMLPAGVPMRVADYEDPPALRHALSGIAVLLLVASDGDGRAILRHHANVIAAAAAAGVGHVVFLSIVDVDDWSPFYYAPVYRDAERRLQAAGPEWTVLRCGLYADFLLAHWLRPALAAGELTLPVGQARIAPVSRADVAAAAAAAAAVPEHGAVHELTGPEALSFGEVAAAADALGAELRFRPSSPPDYLLRLWNELPDPWPHAFSTLCASIAEGRFGRVAGGVEALTGRPAERFDAFLRRAAAAGARASDQR